MSHEKERKIAELKAASSIIGKGVLDFKRVFLTYAFVLLINGIIYLLLQVYPNLENSLAASKLTPWGIITSIFTHSSLSHFTFNMGGLFLFMFLFAFCNSTFHVNVKRRIERFFLVSVFVFAIFSNILWVSLKPSPSIGASGLLYAIQGVLVGFSFANGLQLLNFSKFKTQRISTISIILMNIFVFASLLTQVILTPEIFLSVGQGVNIIVHGISFLLGFFASVPWYLIGKLSILD